MSNLTKYDVLKHRHLSLLKALWKKKASPPTTRSRKASGRSPPHPNNSNRADSSSLA